MLVGQIEHEEPLPRAIEHMNPHKVVEDPPCGGVLDALAFLVWKGGCVVLERVANAVLSGRIDAQTDGHHHEQGHDTLGLFEREGGGQKWRVCEETKSTFRPGVPFIAVEHRLGGSLLLIQVVCREDTTALLVEACPTVREP